MKWPRLFGAAKAEKEDLEYLTGVKVEFCDEDNLGFFDVDEKPSEATKQMFVYAANDDEAENGLGQVVQVSVMDEEGEESDDEGFDMKEVDEEDEAAANWVYFNRVPLTILTLDLLLMFVFFGY